MEVTITTSGFVVRTISSNRSGVKVGTGFAPSFAMAWLANAMRVGFMSQNATSSLVSR